LFETGRLVTYANLPYHHFCLKPILLELNL